MDSEGRSLSSAMPIPNWMKSKRNNRFDLDQSAFSPTEMDDAFLYMGTKTNTTSTQNHGLAGISQSIAPEVGTDISKHPLPCQKFLQNPQVAEAQQVVITASTSKLKSCGVDDGFKGEAAKCGSSIIRVAHQMVASRGLLRTAPSFPEESMGSEDMTPLGFNPARRGSKSLPASPMMSPSTSPKARRRHKYFTSPFVDPQTGREGGVLTNLLGKREISQSLNVIAEKDVDESMKHGLSVTSVSEAPVPIRESAKAYTPKPSELREMNFWSPTSM